MSPCPVCRAAAGPRPENPSGPFCSERCRMVDLGAWLSDSYVIPGDPTDDTAEAPVRVHRPGDDDEG